MLTDAGALAGSMLNPPGESREPPRKAAVTHTEHKAETQVLGLFHTQQPVF